MGIPAKPRKRTPPAKRAAKRPVVRVGEARERILEVASRMLRDVGPDGLRLQEIAREVGVSHPAILDGHIEIHPHQEDDVARALVVGEAEKDPAAILEACFRALTEQRYGRLIAWLALAEVDERRVMSRIGAVVEIVHGLRTKALEAAGLECPPLEDTANVVMLASFALLGDSICGHMLRKVMPAQKDDRGESFRRWLAARLVQQLETPREP